jgi:hypothetical protein
MTGPDGPYTGTTPKVLAALARMRPCDILPDPLRYLRHNHYRVVHLVPAAAPTTVSGNQNPK